LILTESQYRQLSGDTRSPWISTGDVAGASTFVPLAEEEVESYLATFLVPTEHTEENAIDFIDTVRMGQIINREARIKLKKVRLLTGSSYPITVVFYPRLTTGSTSTKTTGIRVIEKRKAELDVWEAWRYLCDKTPERVEITYWAGFTEVPYRARQAVALLTREKARESIVKSGVVMDDDYPHYAQVKSLSALGISRSFDVDGYMSYFGKSPLAQYVERILTPLQVKRVRGV